ncbi:MAG TPA: hypothetical protein DEB06_10530 [Phycisphaerales bacterium]|nr:hypothetical protein [Phycisphaerales bacterium]
MHLGDDYADGEEGRLDLPRPDLDWFGELLVSARAWRLLEPLMGEHVQALPVDFTTGEECFILNVLTVLAGVIDPVASQAEYFKSGRIMRVERMVFGVDDPLYNWPPAFRIAEMRATRFINAEVRELIRDAGLTGGAFTPVEVRLKPR